MKWYLIAFFLMNVSFTAFASDFPFEKSKLNPSYYPPGSFVVPNERQPKKALAIYRAAPRGVYITVGTERGFIAAANAPNVGGLVLVDSNPFVVSYNQANILLLQMSDSREDYLWLRLKASQEDWQQRGQKKGLKESDLKFLMRAHRGLEQLKSDGLEGFHTNWGAILGKNRGPFGGGINYLYNEELFDRLHQLAINGRIWTGEMQLDSGYHQKLLIEWIERNGLRVSALDLSNAHWGKYMEKAGLVSLIDRFKTVASPETLLITTGFKGLNLPMAIFTSVYNWSYDAFRFDEIARSENTEQFVFRKLRLGPLQFSQRPIHRPSCHSIFW